MARAAAAEESGLPLYRYFNGSGGMQLPVPMMNVINGGAHANNNLDLQEFMIIPGRRAHLPRGGALGRRGVPRAEEDHPRQGHDHRVGDEGGFAPCRGKPRSAIQLILRRPSTAGLHRWRPDRHRPGLRRQRVLQGRHTCSKAKACKLTAEQWTDMLATWCDKYPIISIEDGMAEGDWDGWKHPDRAPGQNVSWSATTCS